MAVAVTDPMHANRSTLYDEDFFEWTQRSAELLRAGRPFEADLEHIAEEIEDMGKRDRRGVNSRLRVLLLHLLKWTRQPGKRSASWRASIDEQRHRLVLILRDSPSLARYGRETLSEIYRDAVKGAVQQTGLPPDSLPAICPYTFDQILDFDFYPESPFTTGGQS